METTLVRCENNARNKCATTQGQLQRNEAQTALCRLPKTMAAKTGARSVPLRNCAQRPPLRFFGNSSFSSLAAPFGAVHIVSFTHHTHDTRSTNAHASHQVIVARLLRHCRSWRSDAWIG